MFAGVYIEDIDSLPNLRDADLDQATGDDIRNLIRDCLNGAENLRPTARNVKACTSFRRPNKLLAHVNSLRLRCGLNFAKLVLSAKAVQYTNTCNICKQACCVASILSPQSFLFSSSASFAGAASPGQS
jgi:hypothetical protein